MRPSVRASPDVFGLTEAASKAGLVGAWAESRPTAHTMTTSLIAQSACALSIAHSLGAAKRPMVPAILRVTLVNFVSSRWHRRFEGEGAGAIFGPLLGEFGQEIARACAELGIVNDLFRPRAGFRGAR